MICVLYMCHCCQGDVHGRYNAVDKDTPTPTDRQVTNHTHIYDLMWPCVTLHDYGVTLYDPHMFSYGPCINHSELAMLYCTAIVTFCDPRLWPYVILYEIV